MRKTVILLLLAALPIVAFSQKYKVISGEYSALVGITEFNVQVDYSEVKYYKKNLTEEEYIAKRITDKDGDDIEKIEEEWTKTKDIRIPDKIIAAGNKNGDSGVSYSQNPDLKYTMIVRPQWIYPGWFGGVMKEPSKLNVDYDFVETANPSNVLLSVSCTGAIGDMYPMGIPVTNNRIAEAFAHAGKGLAKTLKKKVK